MEGKNTKDVVIPLTEAKLLRDEISKLLIDNYTLINEKKEIDPTIKVEINGGNW